VKVFIFLKSLQGKNDLVLADRKNIDDLLKKFVPGNQDMKLLLTSPFSLFPASESI
jgi:hypothetical protein